MQMCVRLGLKDGSGEDRDAVLERVARKVGEDSDAVLERVKFERWVRIVT